MRPKESTASKCEGEGDVGGKEARRELGLSYAPGRQRTLDGWLLFHVRDVESTPEVIKDTNNVVPA